jgi:uncharacterized phiE125 gp8 family phage protein
MFPTSAFPSQQLSPIEPRKKTANVFARQIVPPSCTGVDYSDYLTFGRKLPNADPMLLQMKADAGVEIAERYTGLCLVNQVVDQFCDNPVDEVELVNSPVRLVQSVNWTNIDGVEAAVDTDIYVASAIDNPRRLSLQIGNSWPQPSRQFEGLRVRTICGYATPFTFDSPRTTLTATNHPYSNGDAVTVSCTGGDLPASVRTSSVFYVVNSVALTSVQLSQTPGGSAYAFLDKGTKRESANFFQMFLGRIPPNIVRAIIIIAVTDMFEIDDYDAGNPDIPQVALGLLGHFKPKRI